MARKPIHWLWLASSSVAVVAGLGLLFVARSGGEEPAHGPERVAPEHHYYVMLSLVEVKPSPVDGGKWDAGGSAPDVYYRIEWRGHVVFESSTKDDTLVARWSTAEFDVGLLAERVSVDDSIRAARITARPGETIRIRVRDADAVADDEIGVWEVDVADLEVGDQVWRDPAPNVISAVCRVVAVDAVDLEELTR